MAFQEKLNIAHFLEKLELYTYQLEFIRYIRY